MNNVVKNSKTSPKKSVTAKQLAKSNLTKRKNPDWDNLDRGYRYLTLDMKLPHDLAVAVMGNVVEESLGDYKSVLKNGRGRGLIQWDGRNAPNGRYSLWGSIWASVAKPANVYDSTTDTVKNYWAPWGGLKGDEVRLKFIKAPLKEKARIYAESYLRPGKPRIADRQLSTMQLDSIYNPRIKNIIIQKDGGKMNILEFLKKGSGIHIKEKNKGKFTSYCGGKVTDKCILKGKNSSNPAIRKRATFAANARKWKHLKGGNIVKIFKLRRYLEGGLTTGNKFDYGQIINVASDVLSTILLNKAVDASIKNLRVLAELLKKKLFYNNYKSLLGLQLDRSPIVNLNRAYIQANNMSDVSDINQLFLNQEQELLNLKLNNTSRLISSIGGLALSYFSSLGNKNQISTTGKNDPTPSSVRKTYTTEITKPFNNTADEWRQLIIN